ncbi:FAD-binding oxidoreductase [Fictibacillus terranigra]|uniref:FAD-binding oxidoreductase n=1 Tax=Fictibacillus terranigra TaxID=3058424 RepID=A0ABT8E8P2_9BACL|nr:FAD-binding oxidoreductase [Fictibacillus sp. CENA-BCM004]MDN4074286.1 FAD-binding oxidoreductase [Fictibacillus sp. CENA-BCM004]
MKRNVLLVVFLLFFIGGWTASVAVYKHKQDAETVEDISGLLPTKVKEIRRSSTQKDLQAWIKDAAKSEEKISIAGMQHSQGGQTYYPNSILLDMKSFNKVLDYKPRQKRITVQSGATWDDVQRYIHKDGFAIQVMQSQNIFTVGGSISVNVHGRDIRYGSLIDTVESLRLLKADGKIVNVSRKENPELFKLVNGGYGLFGVILDVTLKLAQDEWYENEVLAMDYREYTDYFKQRVKEDPNIRMHMARLSIAPDSSFFKEMYATNYRLVKNQKPTKNEPLRKDGNAVLPKALLGTSRYSEWGKKLLWKTQKSYFLKQNGKVETRNNVMRSDSEFMEYDSQNRTELLQEYFVPVDEFSSYVEDLRDILTKENLNVLNITIRYVDQDQQAVMSYAKQDMFALVWLINQEKSKIGTADTKKVVRKLIDITLDHGGSYYLPYYPFATQSQLERAYPNAQQFFELKRKYDPSEMFMNYLYKEYGDDV